MIEAGKRLRLASALLVGGLLLAACGAETQEVVAPEGVAESTEEATASGPLLVIETDAGTVEVRVELADTQAERARGLMGREELAEDAGMVFLHEEPTTSGFWMKDTLIPLSLAVWDEAGVIGAILDMEPCEADPCQVYEPGVEWMGAVEVNQGFFAANGVSIVDTVRLEG